MVISFNQFQRKKSKKKNKKILIGRVSFETHTFWITPLTSKITKKITLTNLSINTKWHILYLKEMNKKKTEYKD